MKNAFQLWLLIAAAALFAIGISPIWLICLSKVSSQHRAAQMGILYTFWLVGLGSGPVVINFVIDKSYDLSYWLMMGLWVAAWLLSLRINNRTESIPEPIALRKQASMLWERMRGLGSLLPGMILQTAAAGILVPVLPGFAAKKLGLHYSQYSYLLLIGGAFTVMFLIPMGKLSDKWGGKWFLILGFAGFAVSLFSLTFVSKLWEALAMAAVLGFSYSAVLPAWNALLAQYVPQEQQGTGWGIFSSVEGIGVVIGPVIGGWLAQRFHESVSIWVSAAILGCIALYYLLFPPDGAWKKLGT